MKMLFKLKRKLHYLINCLFYLLFFVAGFLLGGGSLEQFEKIIDYINIFN